MYKIEAYILSVIRAIILTAVSIFTSQNIHVMFLLFGFLMIMLTLRSVTDKLYNPSIFILSVLYALIARNIPAFLIMYECRFKKSIRIFLPSVVYIIHDFVMGCRNFPLMTFRFILLMATSLLLYFIEFIISRYYNAMQSVRISVNTAAISEMYTKKLNQELVIKNFLADRNARLEERENISRSIHNSVGHSITAAIMTLEAAEMLFDKSPERSREKIITAKERIRTGLDSIRHAVRILDNDAINVSLADFLNEIRIAADEFVMDTMRKIHTDFPENDDELYIPREHTEFLSGAFKEFLSNGVKHGGADVFFLHITADSSHIRLIVRDNGKSDFSDDNASERLSEGFGLKKLKAYTKRCGGTAVFSNDNGFKSEITLPFEGGHNE